MLKLPDNLPLIVAAGMAFEARIAKGAGVRAVYGQKREAYIRNLHDLVRVGARGIISFGVAGGLSPSLKPGDVVVASSVVTAKARFTTDPHWFAVAAKRSSACYSQSARIRCGRHSHDCA